MNLNEDLIANTNQLPTRSDLMTDLQLTQIICNTLQTGLGREFRCRVSLPWRDQEYVRLAPAPAAGKYKVLIYDGPNEIRPCGAVYYNAEKATLNFQIIEHDNSPAPLFSVPLAQPDAFEQIENRIACKD